MPLRIAINGVGRIGRALVRRLVERDDLVLVAANDLTPLEQLAQLLRRDSFHGAFPGEVETAGDRLIVDGREVRLHHAADIADIPWSESGAELVVEATGVWTQGRLAEAHLGGSVEHVLMSWNAEDADITVCYGVNHREIRLDEHRLISNASCTTNCLAAVANVLDSEIGIARALLNTVHCFNNNQHLTDGPHPDPRRARSAALNMVPTTTGASSAIGRVMPRLAARLDGFAVRVPAGEVSLIDLVAELEADAGPEEINEIFRRASEGDLRGVLGVSDEPLVSSDFIGDTRSAVVDLPLTQVVGGRLARVVAWYDNEMGYASRLADVAAWIGRA